MNKLFLLIIITYLTVSCSSGKKESWQYTNVESNLCCNKLDVLKDHFFARYTNENRKLIEKQISPEMNKKYKELLNHISVDSNPVIISVEYNQF